MVTLGPRPDLDAAHVVIGAFSTTWYDSVLRLPPGLNAAVSATYLMLRAVDEVEDHPELPAEVRVRVLRGISDVLQEQHPRPDFAVVLRGLEDELPEVTLRLGEWALLAPQDIAPRIHETAATMCERMARWAAGRPIRTLVDFERYAYAVIGTVVLLLGDLWTWFDGTRVDRARGIGYARALQALNVYGDRDEDLARGVDFWPDGWGEPQVRAYARRQLQLGDEFVASLPSGSPGHAFCHGVLSRARTVLETAGGGVP